MVYLIAEDPVAYGSFKDHHGKSGKDAGNKEEDGDKLRIPQRMDLPLGHHEQSPETRLMKGGKRNADDHRSYGKRTEELSDFSQIQATPQWSERIQQTRRSCRAESARQSRKSTEFDTEFIPEQRIGDVPPATEIKEDGSGIKDIGKKTV